MRTFKQKFKKNLTLLIFIAMFSSHSNVFAEDSETEQADIAKADHHAVNNLWPGVYQGFLPCDDCKGIKTSLALNNNNTYLLITQHVGKSPRDIVEKGKFVLDHQKNTIILTARNSKQTRQYFIGEDTLTQLDNNGNHIVGTSGDRYTLHKAEMRQPEPSSSHH